MKSLQPSDSSRSRMLMYLQPVIWEVLRAVPLHTSVHCAYRNMHANDSRGLQNGHTRLYIKPTKLFILLFMWESLDYSASLLCLPSLQHYCRKSSSHILILKYTLTSIMLCQINHNVVTKHMIYSTITIEIASIVIIIIITAQISNIC